MQEYFRSRCLRQEWHPDPLEQPRLLLFAGRNSIPRVCRPSDVSEAYFITPGLLNSRIVLDSYVTFALFFLEKIIGPRTCKYLVTQEPRLKIRHHFT